MTSSLVRQDSIGNPIDMEQAQDGYHSSSGTSALTGFSNSVGQNVVPVGQNYLDQRHGQQQIVSKSHYGTEQNLINVCLLYTSPSPRD